MFHFPSGEEPQRETVDGESLKSPQEISNILSRADVSVPYDSTLTEMVLEWGQFITNDITVVPETGMYCVHVYYSPSR